MLYSNHSQSANLSELLVCSTMSKQGSQSSGHDQKTQAWSQHQVMHLHLKQKKKIIRSILEHTYYGEKKGQENIYLQLNVTSYFSMEFFTTDFSVQLLFKLIKFSTQHWVSQTEISWITNMDRCMWKMCSNCSCKLRNMLMALAVVGDRFLVWHIARKTFNYTKCQWNSFLIFSINLQTNEKLEQEDGVRL